MYWPLHFSVSGCWGVCSEAKLILGMPGAILSFGAVCMVH